MVWSKRAPWELSNGHVNIGFDRFELHVFVGISVSLPLVVTENTISHNKELSLQCVKVPRKGRKNSLNIYISKKAVQFLMYRYTIYRFVCTL
jgi:hypothetical protein